MYTCAIKIDSYANCWINAHVAPCFLQAKRLTFFHCTLNKLKLTFVACDTLSNFTCEREGNKKSLWFKWLNFLFVSAFWSNLDNNRVLDKISRSWLAVPKEVSEAIPQNPGNFKFEAPPNLKYFWDWSIKQGQNFEPIKIQNLSKSGCEFFVLVQVCCPFSRCKMAEIQRFYRANSEYIESPTNASENKNMKGSTRNWLKQFEKW